MIRFKIAPLILTTLALIFTQAIAHGSTSLDVLDKSFKWTGKPKQGTIAHREFVFLPDGQFVFYRWAEQDNGVLINLTLQRGGWKQSGDQLALIQEIPGRQFGEQWVILERLYKVSDTGLSLERVFVQHENALKEELPVGNFAGTFPASNFVGKETFRAFYTSEKRLKFKHSHPTGCA